MKFLLKYVFKFFLGACLSALYLSVSFAGIGTSGTGRGYGEISDFGSIFVNGVEYDVSTANIRISGIDNRPQSELKLGMAVRVEGAVNVGGVTGTATLVEYLGDVEGALDAAPVISGRNGSFTIHGLPIKTDSKTKLDTGVTLANLAAGQFVEVSGLFDANDGSFRATHIERFPMFLKLDLRGFISNVTPTSFTLGPSLVVNYNINDTRDFPLSGPANGMFVEVKANTEPVNGVVTATRVNRESSVLRSTDMQLGHVQGVAANVTAGGFVMGNQPIVTNAQTVFDGAPVSALANGAKAIASGPVVAGVMTAAAVTITPDLTAVLSRKTHGTAGSFDLPIALNTPINGAISVEPRAMGINHTLVFQ